MVYKRGGIYLVNLNPSKGTEPGKIRPVVVLQTDLLNSIGHPTTIVAPLSTQIITDTQPLRFLIQKRDKLRNDSDILLDQIRAVDNRRFTSELLTELTSQERLRLEEMLKLVLGMD